MLISDIYEVLQQHTHNLHYLNRYVKFIEQCAKQNEFLDPDTYVENHHICPKADDMFPEYIDLDLHTWNSCYLTARQHITAHILLWKAFPKAMSQLNAVHYMCNVQNSDLCSISGRFIPIAIKNRYGAKAREEFYKSREGFASYKDSSGNISFLHRDDPKIQELGLVGHMLGYKHSEATRLKMMATKAPNRIIKMYFMNLRAVSVKLYSPEFSEYLAQGWVTIRTKEDLAYSETIRASGASKSLSGRADYATPDGKFFDKLYPDDPRIKELGLVYHKTDARVNAALTNQKLAVEANTGAVWYNNGTINKKFKSPPGDPWVEGVLYSDSQKTREARAAGVRAAVCGTVVYNDGVRNYRFKPTDDIPEHLTKGMAPQKPRSKSPLNVGYQTYNDGKSAFRVYPGDTIDPSWSKGMLPRTPKQ